MATESNRGQPHKSEDGSGALELLWKQCPQAILKQVVPGRHIHRNIVLMTKTFFVLEVEARETILNPGDNSETLPRPPQVPEYPLYANFRVSTTGQGTRNPGSHL